jgi:glycosyltransferase involved in cell wall biosynthesis
MGEPACGGFMPDASVVVTCFNLERYIAPAIQSVLDQDFAGEVEIIVVDDCSTDRSAEIIQGFDGVRYLRTERNCGVLLATLGGTEAAAADVVLFLDGDDLWERGKLGAVVRRFRQNPRIGFVTHDLSYADQNGERLDRPTRPEAEMAGVAPAEVSDKLRSGILELGDFIWLGSAYAVRKSVGKVEGFAEFARALPDPANTYQDWPLAYWVASLSGVELDYIAEKLFRYRLHDLNYSGDASTPDRAIRNFTRTLNTNRAMLAIAEMRNLPADVVRRVGERIALNEYLIDLNGDHRARAAVGLLRNSSQLARRGLLLKELVRFVAIQLMGARRFARIAARRKRFRDVPVT